MKVDNECYLRVTTETGTMIHRCQTRFSIGVETRRLDNDLPAPCQHGCMALEAVVASYLSGSCRH